MTSIHSPKCVRTCNPQKTRDDGIRNTSTDCWRLLGVLLNGRATLQEDNRYTSIKGLKTSQELDTSCELASNLLLKGEGLCLL